MIVKDDGIGLSENREGSLGLGLVRALVKQISGKLDFESAMGLTVTISFPNEPSSVPGS